MEKYIAEIEKDNVEKEILTKGLKYPLELGKITRKLFKIIVPHGKRVIFDTYGQALYRPLLRVHKNHKNMDVNFKSHLKPDIVGDDSIDSKKWIPSILKPPQFDKYNRKDRSLREGSLRDFWTRIKNIYYTPYILPQKYITEKR